MPRPSRSPGRRAFRPSLKPAESRRLLHAGAVAALVPHAAALVGPVHANPLAPYRVFVGTIQRGPAAGLTLDGPLVLGFDGRIQVIGFLFQQGGPRITVVGTAYGGSVALRFVIPTARGTAAVEAVGTGQLRKVAGGLPDGLTLVGSGNLSGPDFKRDSGHWLTVAPPPV